MKNEIILIVSLIVIYSGVLLMYRLFGKAGLITSCISAIILANIEVLILVDAFFIKMTLGNILYAATTLITDIFSEIYGKKESHKMVNMMIAASVLFVIISQSWLLYIPSSEDWVSPFISAIFTNTPRVIFVSLAVNAISQKFDIWIYYKLWSLTEKISGDKKAFLWVRNNFSTFSSQLLNVVMFNIGAFYGVYDASTLFSICASSYIIYVITAAADTPFVYIARRMHEKYGL